MAVPVGTEITVDPTFNLLNNTDASILVTRCGETELGHANRPLEEAKWKRNRSHNPARRRENGSLDRGCRQLHANSRGSELRDDAAVGWQSYLAWKAARTALGRKAISEIDNQR